ncbi:hypothetical protein AWH62_11390 [Maricaulis sp. W15]|uniref:Peptidase S74 domain-containing protein n=2 Tax=Maricaulaceae TaxID=2800061 RepID=A0A495CY77_9PROT|nr:hypothetical protein AWH62_11390 [Maricaulis sp. W15]RKQ94143.1 hypothetical protein C7435_3115 [Maricaulis maris]
MALMAIAPSSARADIQHLDDVIITFSLCVGNDCVNGESFGFDTLRLKENNLRIHFDDTSSSASFPANDWRIVVNDSNNGGGSYFAIEDSTAGRQVFRVDAGAPANSLRIDSAGDVGIGSSNPVVDLHVVSGNTPTLRLAQDGSSGFTPQTFDVAANEANFFIRDVTNGSALAFRIQPGADENALFIASDNDIGLGTNSPQAALHLRRTNATASILVEETNGTAASRGLMTLRNNGTVYLGLEDLSISGGADTGQIWNLQNDTGRFRITTAPGGADEVELELDHDGNLTIEGELVTAGSCSIGCDRVFSDDYELLDISEHADLMFQLGYLPNVGPTPEDGPFNVTDKMGRMLNELEHAHIYIAQQQSLIDQLSVRVAALEVAEAP